MNIRSNLAALVLCSLGLMAFSSLKASAGIVCNGAGACWHTQETYVYPPGVQIEVHPDNWRWRDNEHFVWKEHPGRGYWREDRWQAF